jgi:sensor histidine kinase YesM
MGPGEYTFEVIAENEDGIWNVEPATISFIILRPFWQTWWFIGALALLAGILIWQFILWRIRVNNRDNNNDRRVVELQSSALRAQMNPHFTYNAMNSIQSLIAQDDNENATIYLAQFASLMRNTLDASIDKTISLQKELQIIKEYLLLEKLRFKDKFEFEIEVEKNVRPSAISVPPMIIQPFVENAILHGILPSGRNGIVRVEVKQSGDDSILIQIIDNGAGLNIDDKSSREHESHGTTITKSRLRLLNKENTLTIVNRKEEGENVSGTRVSMLVKILSSQSGKHT